MRRKNGRFVRLLEPGRHWLLLPGESAAVVDLRPKLMEIASQEIPTRDQALLRASAVARYRIADARLALESTSDAPAELYSAIQLRLRQALIQRDVEEALSERATIDAELLPGVRDVGIRLGLEVSDVGVKDLVAAGELKKTLAEAARARAEGRAKLERARGETAAMRNLLNAASLVRENDGLYELRVLEAASRLGESQGNSLALEIRADRAPKEPKRRRSK